jgi:hypothetical protein
MFLTQVAHSGKSPFDDLFKAKVLTEHFYWYLGICPVL